jgi:hypothetical protein
MRFKRAIKITLLAVCAVALFAVAPTIYSFISYYNTLQQEVIERFSGKRWTIPSRIYSHRAAQLSSSRNGRRGECARNVLLR